MGRDESLDQQKLEQQLLKEMNAARKKYDEAKLQSQNVQQRYKDLPLGHPDGATARLQVLELENRALHDYNHALQTFADLVLRGRRPLANAEDDPEQARVSSNDGLTPRELEVLKLIASGHTSKEIAHQLGITFKTVVSHRSHIMDKLEVHDVAGLVRFAIRQKLIDV